MKKKPTSLPLATAVGLADTQTPTTDSSRKSRAKCKKIVDRYHGVIYGEGIENEGAGIVLFLPQSLN